MEEWQYLNQGTLVATSLSRVCMICRRFCHHEGVNYIPMLTCQSYRALVC